MEHAAAVAALDAEIAYHSAAATKAKLRRNALIPVSRLPAELLGEIFTICVRRSQDYHQRYPDFEYRPYWWLREAAHICHSWREVALNTSELWDTIHGSGRRIDLIEQCIKLSKQRPLAITITEPIRGTIYMDGDILELVVAEAERARALHLRLAPDQYNYAYHHFPSTVPHLRSPGLPQADGQSTEVARLPTLIHWPFRPQVPALPLGWAVSTATASRRPGVIHRNRDRVLQSTLVVTPAVVVDQP